MMLKLFSGWRCWEVHAPPPVPPFMPLNHFHQRIRLVRDLLRLCTTVDLVCLVEHLVDINVNGTNLFPAVHEGFSFRMRHVGNLAAEFLFMTVHVPHQGVMPWRSARRCAGGASDTHSPGLGFAMSDFPGS